MPELSLCGKETPSSSNSIFFHKDEWKGDLRARPRGSTMRYIRSIIALPVPSFTTQCIVYYRPDVFNIRSKNLGSSFASLSWIPPFFYSQQSFRCRWKPRTNGIHSMSLALLSNPKCTPGSSIIVRDRVTRIVFLTLRLRSSFSSSSPGIPISSTRRTMGSVWASSTLLYYIGRAREVVTPASWPSL